MITIASAIGHEVYAQLPSSGTHYLTQDITLTTEVSISNGKTLTLINNTEKDITISGGNVGTMFTNSGTLIMQGNPKGRIIIDGGASMSIDSTTIEGIKFTVPTNIKKRIAIYSTNTIRMEYVTVQNVYSNKADGAALYLSIPSNKEANLINCIISKCYAQRGSAIMISSGSVGDIHVTDSKINCCFSGGGSTDKTGGAIRTYGSTKSSLYLENVKFRRNRALRITGWNDNWEKDGSGGAIFWNARGLENTKCSINGCLFENNASDDNGGAIKTQASIEFVGKKTYIKNNVAPVGAGLYIEGYIGSSTTPKRDLTFDLSSSLVVTDNRAPEYLNKAEKTISGLGAGIHLWFSKDMDLAKGSRIFVTLNGATIERNTAEGPDAKGGGIYFENSAKPDYYDFFIFLNDGKISNNTSSKYGGGVYVYDGNVSYDKEKEDGKLEIKNNHAAEGAGIFIQNGDLTILNGEISSNRIENSGNGAGVHINTGGMTIEQATISSNSIIQKGNGGGIYIENGNFTINAGEISGNTVSNGNGGGVYIVGSSGNGNFTMDGKGFINGNSASGNSEDVGFGGGIYVNGGNFTMTEFATEGQISSNASTKDGGGVYINGGQFIQTAGSISSNTSGGNGGGVCIVEGGTFTMSGGSIAGNGKGNDISTAKSQNGGGVYLNGGNFVLENGTISENGASENGGGVFLTGADCRYTLEQGDITENNAKYGGGVFLERGQFILGSASRTADGNISGNTAVKGGGVYIGSESDNIVPSSDEGASATLSEGFVMHGGKIENNSTSSDGGGIYLSGGNFTQNNGVIQANTSSTNGGGIYLLGGSFLQNMGTISNNKSVTNGGGICIVGGDFTMAGGSISNNGMSADRTYTQNGGGIYLQEGNFIQNDGIISGNSSTTNGGGACIEGGNFTMNGGSISENGKRGDNIETDNGGGVFLNDGKLTVTEGEIKLNTSRDYGGGIYILNGEVDMGSGVIKQNKCDFYGGGVYVFNNGGDDIPIKFEGGILNQNEAQFGGGICVNGKINLTINNIQIVNNRAINGGGVCLMNNAKMNFGTGQIIQNHAYTDENTTYSGNTGHLTGIADLKGIGGGVYLDSNTTLTFDDSDGVQLGLFGNKADNGADELFANGSGTTVNVPDVTTMKLDGFTGAGNLKWIEDYIRNDSGYLNGTNLLGYTESTEDKTVMRYKDMISMNMQHIPQLVGGIGIDDDNAKKYICFALGYEVIFITISKSGLANGESAIYTLEKMPGSSDGEIIDDSISDDEDQPNEIKFRVVLTGNGNDIIRKKVAVTAGIWRVSETGWSWTYTDNQAIEKDVTDGKNREFGFTSQKHSELPMYDEDIVFHELGGSSSQLN